MPDRHYYNYAPALKLLTPTLTPLHNSIARENVAYAEEQKDFEHLSLFNAVTVEPRLVALNAPPAELQECAKAVKEASSAVDAQSLATTNLLRALLISEEAWLLNQLLGQPRWMAPLIVEVPEGPTTHAFHDLLKAQIDTVIERGGVEPSVLYMNFAESKMLTDSIFGNVNPICMLYSGPPPHPEGRGGFRISRLTASNGHVLDIKVHPLIQKGEALLVNTEATNAAGRGLVVEVDIDYRGYEERPAEDSSLVGIIVEERVRLKVRNAACVARIDFIHPEGQTSE